METNTKQPILDTCDSFDIHNIISEPTRLKNKPPLLDVITTHKHFLTNDTIETGLSDFHKLIYTVARNHTSYQNPKHLVYCSYQSFDQNIFNEDIADAPFDVGAIFDYVDDKCFYFETLLLDIFDHHAPQKQKVVRQTSPLYRTQDIAKPL